MVAARSSEEAWDDGPEGYGHLTQDMVVCGQVCTTTQPLVMWRLLYPTISGGCGILFRQAPFRQEARAGFRARRREVQEKGCGHDEKQDDRRQDDRQDDREQANRDDRRDRGDP